MGVFFLNKYWLSNFNTNKNNLVDVYFIVFNM